MYLGWFYLSEKLGEEKEKEKEKRKKKRVQIEYILGSFYLSPS